jgi:thiol-disulfide isomerase/thioredoxin
MEPFLRAYRRARAYADVQQLKFPIALLNPANKVAVGNMAPAFAFPEIGTGKKVTNEGLRGRYYLLDFWATWCGPCIAERGALTRAQERFGGERFTVVSASLDESEEAVMRFRQRRWPMPWPNVFVGGQYKDGDVIGFDVPAAREFDLDWIGLPQLVFVSPEGRVLALRDQLEGPLLERTLAEYLGTPSRSPMK